MNVIFQDGVAVCGRARAPIICDSLALASDGSRRRVFLASFCDPGDDPPSISSVARGDVLVTKVRDVSSSAASGAPSREHMAALLEFLRGIGPGDAVAFQCEGGVGRSAAAALLHFASLRPEDGGAAAMERVSRLAPSCRPNPLMAAFAEELTGCVGLAAAARAFAGRVSLRSNDDECR
jgi:predicted protein tyrosine phosphatase